MILPSVLPTSSEDALIPQDGIRGTEVSPKSMMGFGMSLESLGILGKFCKDAHFVREQSIHADFINGVLQLWFLWQCVTATLQELVVTLSGILRAGCETQTLNSK